MSFKIAGMAVLGLLAVAPMSNSFAQEALASGANSFTEGQARGRIEDAGFSDVSELRKDDNGIWRGKAVRNGSPTEVGLDFKGNVVAGAATAAPGAAGNNAVNVNPTRDGAPGNPPGTAAGRATDRAVGATAPDGTPANPSGTAAGRALDNAAGTNTPDGTPGNPSGTAASRALDNAAGTNTSGANPAGNAPDGTPGNPAGTAAGRATDRALGTNSTGPNPSAPAR